jgi:protein O-GlcNAc transferase
VVRDSTTTALIAIDCLERVELVSDLGDGKSHFDVYQRIDVALDTFPWSGHTTCAEGMWMGVPAITCGSTRRSSRLVSTLLTSLGLEEWIADSLPEYIAKAISLTGSIDQLVELRGRLRSTMLASPLCDGPGFARRLEKLLAGL